MFFKIALRNMLRHPRQSVLAIAVVAVGVMAMIFFDAFNQGIMKDYRTKIIEYYFGNGQVFTEGYYEKKPNPVYKGWISNETELEDKLATFHGLKGVFPRSRVTGFLSRGGANIVAVGVGIDALSERAFFTGMPIVEGERLLDQPKGVQLGIDLAKSLGAKLGDKVTFVATTVDGLINAVELDLVGIFKSGMPNLDGSLFFFPLQQAKILLESEKVEYLSVGLKDYDSWSQFQSWFNANITGHQALAFEEIDKVYYANSVKFLANQFLMMAAIFVSIIAITLFNTMSTLVHERRKEIAVARVNGEPRHVTFLLFVVEALYLGILGSFIGMAIAFGSYALFFQKGIWMPPAPGFSNSYYAQLYFSFPRGLTLCLLGIFGTLVGCVPIVAFTLSRPLSKLFR
jgi:putative ABC transport system permease protein